jgi:hypothetical protein
MASQRSGADVVAMVPTDVQTVLLCPFGRTIALQRTLFTRRICITVAT